jgi:hypothetical protein
MLGRKFLSVIVALVLVSQVGVLAQNPPVVPNGSGEIAVSGSELQRQAAGKTDADSLQMVFSQKSGDQGNFKLEPIQEPLIFQILIILVLLAPLGFSFFAGIKFAEHRARTKQPPTLK